MENMVRCSDVRIFKVNMVKIIENIATDICFAGPGSPMASIPPNEISSPKGSKLFSFKVDSFSEGVWGTNSFLSG